jgi:hypothetical protein
MCPLRLYLAAGIRFLSWLWHEFTNSGLSSLWTKGRSKLESVCVLWITARRSTGTTGASITSTGTLSHPITNVAMKQFLKWTGLLLLAVVVGLALAFAFTAAFRLQRGGASITLDQAVESTRQYLAAYGNTDLALTEVMEFSDNFYAEVEEQSTSIHAFELLIDRYTGAVYPEPGPNMMWNTRYGHMGGWRGRQTESMSVTLEQARDIAQGWLNKFLPGTSVAEKADAFYGYYTIHVMKDGQVDGMLSVNGYSGDVWYHTWHGDFIDMKVLEE